MMLILTIRTDKPEAELGLFDNEQQVDYVTWQAHRALAETIHSTLRAMLIHNTKTLQDVEGIVCFKGPGSFTGLRIGAAVANAFASSLSVPIIGAQTDVWQQQGIAGIMAGDDDTQVVPDYGAPVHITVPKH